MVALDQVSYFRTRTPQQLILGPLARQHRLLQHRPWQLLLQHRDLLHGHRGELDRQNPQCRDGEDLQELVQVLKSSEPMDTEINNFQGHLWL